MTRLVALAALVLAAAGCETDPYCLDCFAGDGGPPADVSATGEDGGAGSDAAPAADACVVTGIEVCNGEDDDCDGVVDDGAQQVGDACGAGLPPPCQAGVFECVDGELSCGGGAVLPQAELCNAADDDCDGTVDDGDPGGGVLCGSDVGECQRGVTECVAGGLACQGEVGPAAEVCDGRDNDCDGTNDDGDPEGGASCGEGMGSCVPGTIHCVGGVLQCLGALPPTIEACDGLDNDCDGVVDDGFDLTADPNNCGWCGNVCLADDAVAGCSPAGCVVAYCLTDHVDLNGEYSDGCEYACAYQGSEICNGLDDDCDGLTDEGLTAPAICATLGECAGTTATCAGLTGWSCDYGPTVALDGAGAIVPESDCDDLDNDCDGDVDEAFPAKGSTCWDGVGACTTTGLMDCDAAGTALECTAPPPPPPPMAGEACNGIDDDCDGSVDESAPDSWVPISGAGVTGTKWIYRYEASRPDATAASAGAMSHRSCSNPGVLPWTNVTQPEAEAACAAAGGRLCSEAEWQRGCETTAATACKWSYDATCTTYSASKCNGNDYDLDPGTPATNEDGLLAAGALAACYANWGSMANRIFDLSGNVKEWTLERSPGVNPLRGGSYNNTPTGITCQWSFVVADDSFQFANVGFRCCRDTAP